MTKDLGTYHLKVELVDGRGWIETWNTGWRYTQGTDGYRPLDATPIPPTYEDEKAIFFNMMWMYIDGNYSCDCNKALFLAYSQQQDPPWNTPCGDTMTLKRLTAIRPDRTEKVLYEVKL